MTFTQPHRPTRIPSRWRAAVTAHPRRTAVAIGAAEIALTAAGAGLVAALFPEMSVWGARLSVVLLLAVATAALLAVTRTWKSAAFRRPVRRAHLLILPAAVAAAPLLGGLSWPGMGLFTILATGYAATAFVEEGLFRGVILGAARPAGRWSAVLISSGLFAAAHLANSLFGQPLAISAAQAVGTFCFGVGYSAARLATGSLWPLMILHFATDLFLRLDTLPAGAHWAVMVCGDTVLAIYGLVLLRSAGRKGPPIRRPIAAVADVPQPVCRYDASLRSTGLVLAAHPSLRLR